MAAIVEFTVGTYMCIYIPYTTYVSVCLDFSCGSSFGMYSFMLQFLISVFNSICDDKRCSHSQELVGISLLAMLSKCLDTQTVGLWFKSP